MKAKTIKKLIIIGAALLCVVLFIAFDLDRYLSLDYIKDSREYLQNLYAENPLGVIGVYMSVYIVVTALSLPGAIVMTLSGGALFGVLTGTVVVSIASTTGATLACFVSRFLLQDWVQNRFGDRLTAINRGIEREGGFYLFTLRLIPIFPFFVINLVMGLTRMPLFRFFWVSQLGMLPGTVVYVNAGKQLGQIDSVSGILSPSVLISFVILGLFPITAKKIMQFVRRRMVDKAEGELKDGKV